MTDDQSPTAPTDDHPPAESDSPAGDIAPNDRTPPDAGRAGSNADAGSAVPDALRDHAIPLETTDPSADLDDLEPLRDRLSEVRIAGLGEATHGTREFFRLKHRLIRYLVTELDLRAVALEANFPETLAVDDYVVRGEGDPREALEGIYFWTWNTEEVLDLIEWLRAENADRPLDERIRFYGIDSQYTRGAVRKLREFFEDVDPGFLDADDPDRSTTVREDLAAADDEGEPAHVDDERRERFEAAARLVPRLRERLRDRRDAYAEASSAGAVELALRHVRVLEAAGEYKRAWEERESGDLAADAATKRCLRLRDRAMADTVDWIADRHGSVAVWAHDAHVNRREQVLRGTDVGATSMGGHLADRHGRDYYALGFAFGRGSFQAIGPDPDGESNSLREWTVPDALPDTVEATLSALERPLAVVDLRDAADDERLAEWLAEPRRHFSTGSTYVPDDREEYVTEYVYGEAFDAVCYVDETTRARPLDD